MRSYTDHLIDSTLQRGTNRNSFTQKHVATYHTQFFRKFVRLKALQY